MRCHEREEIQSCLRTEQESAVVELAVNICRICEIEQVRRVVCRRFRLTSRRRIGKLESELNQLQKQTPAILAYVEKCSPWVRVLVIWWFWSVPMVVFDGNVFWPLSWLLSMPAFASDTIGVIAWNEICALACRALLNID
jgi:hypothetical protein